MIEMKEDKSKFMALTHDDILLLTDFFCLPYHHGEGGNRLSQDFEWLLQNVADIYEQPPSKEKVRHHIIKTPSSQGVVIDLQILILYQWPSLKSS